FCPQESSYRIIGPSTAVTPRSGVMLSIFFIDMGAVWQGHEGDAGATLTTGFDPVMIACAVAAGL
ncbi:hypothetical protein ACS77_09735, partial [Pseudomonas syringae]